MNLAIRGIEGQIDHGDSFHNDRHPDLRADFVLANPPFNVSDWGGERLQDDQRCQYGVPPNRNANFAWVQHFLHHLAPRGQAGFVLANGSMSSNQSGEGQIRKNIVEAGLVDCIVALPGQLFRSTQIPACLWFLSRDGSSADRRDQTLFIDARKLGHMIDRTRRDLSPEDINRISNTFHAWQGEEGARAYADTPAFSRAPPSKKSASTATSSPPAATSARRHRRTTANPSSRRWPASPPNGASSRPKRSGWMPLSRKTWTGWGLVRVKAAVPKVREAIQLIERDGWRLIRTRGSHRQFKHPVKSGRVTVPGKPGDDLPPGTWNSILKQSGLKG